MLRPILRIGALKFALLSTFAFISVSHAGTSPASCESLDLSETPVSLIDRLLPQASGPNPQDAVVRIDGRTVSGEKCQVEIVRHNDYTCTRFTYQYKISISENSVQKCEAALAQDFDLEKSTESFVKIKETNSFPRFLATQSKEVTIQKSQGSYLVQCVDRLKLVTLASQCRF